MKVDSGVHNLERRSKIASTRQEQPDPTGADLSNNPSYRKITDWFYAGRGRDPFRVVAGEGPRAIKLVCLLISSDSYARASILVTRLIARLAIQTNQTHLIALAMIRLVSKTTARVGDNQPNHI